MLAREFVNLAQRGLITNPYLHNRLPGLFATNPYELADLVIDYASNAKPLPGLSVDFARIRAVASQFHAKAGTDTDAVKESIARLGTEAPVVRIAHTPDHFAYLAVFAQFIFLDQVAGSMWRKTGVAPTQILLLVDFESVGDKRLRKSYFPDVDYSDGALHISTPISRASYYKSQASVSKPDRKVIHDWLNSLSDLIQHNLSILRRSGIRLQDGSIIRDRFELIKSEIWFAHERAGTLSEFNAIFMSRVINYMWGLNIVFVTLSQITSVFRPVYEYLLPMYPMMTETSNAVVQKLQDEGIRIKQNLILKPNVLPLWYLCSLCNARVHLLITSARRLFVRGICPGCQTTYRFNLGSFEDPDLSIIQDHIAPKLIFDAMSDIIGWKMKGGVSYDGSSEHLIVNSLIAHDLGFAVPPECPWRPRGVYFGLAEIRAAQKLGTTNQKELDKTISSLRRTYWGRGSILYFILAQGVNGIHTMLEQHFERGKQLFEISIGNNPFIIPEENKSALLQAVRGFEL